MPNVKMYFGGHCTAHVCQYSKSKFDSEIYLLFVVLFM